MTKQLYKMDNEMKGFLMPLADEWSKWKNNQRLESHIFVSYMYLSTPPPPAECDARSLLKQSLTSFNSEFSSPIGLHSKFKETSLPKHLLIRGKRIV